MPLPVLKASFAVTSEDLVRFCYKLQLDYCRALGEETQLDCGTALVNAALGRVTGGNCVVDVALSPGLSPQSGFEEVWQHFAASEATCEAWVMNPSAPAHVTMPMVEYLAARGFVPRFYDILYLPRMPISRVLEVGVTIIPARAGYRHVETLAREAATDRGEMGWVEAALLHLDDPHYDAMLAMKESKPVGFAGVLSSGELGGIQDIYVAKDFRRQGFGRTLMSRALEVCARSLFRHVLGCVEQGNIAAQSLFHQIGFERVGEYRVYVPAANQARP